MKPILFNTEMVNAILQGRKTQTRRIIKENHIDDYFEYEDWANSVGKADGVVNSFQSMNEFLKQHSQYQPGDILYVRETWGKDATGKYYYKADKGVVDQVVLSWKPSIHMPKEAARIFLQVKSVRAERLQDISKADAIAEGIKPIEWSRMMPDSKFEDYTGRPRPEDYTHGLNAIESFCSLWESVYGDGSWKSNPWVWVIEFEQIAKP